MEDYVLERYYKGSPELEFEIILSKDKRINICHYCSQGYVPCKISMSRQFNLIEALFQGLYPDVYRFKFCQIYLVDV